MIDRAVSIDEIVNIFFIYIRMFRKARSYGENAMDAYRLYRYAQMYGTTALRVAFGSQAAAVVQTLKQVATAQPNFSALAALPVATATNTTNSRTLSKLLLVSHQIVHQEPIPPQVLSYWARTKVTAQSAYDLISKTNWDPIEITLAMSYYVPLTHPQLAAMLNAFKLVRYYYGPIPLWTTLSYICTCVGILDQQYYGGILRKTLRSIIPYLAKLGFYLTKKTFTVAIPTIFRLLAKIMILLGKTPALLKQLLQMAKKVRTIEKSPKKALSIAYSASPVSPKSPSPRNAQKYQSMVKAVTSVAKKTPKSASPIFQSARSRSA